MNKHLLSLTLVTLFTAHALEARHHKTQTAPTTPTPTVTATSTPVVEVAQPAAVVQTLQEIVKTPEDIRQLVTKLEQHKEVKSWMARNKKFLISAGISAGVITMAVLWWWFKKQNIRNAPAHPASPKETEQVPGQSFPDPLFNTPEQLLVGTNTDKIVGAATGKKSLFND